MAPHHESNLVWGPLGIGSSIVLTVIAAMKHDLRFLFYIAWPCFTFGVWRLCKRVPYQRLSVWVWLGLSVLVAWGLYGLSGWLEPNSSGKILAASPTPKQLSAGIPIINPKDVEDDAHPGALKGVKDADDLRSPPSSQANQQPEGDPYVEKLIFRDSPLFGAEERKLIESTLLSFRRYLRDIGFELTKPLPPVGIAAPDTTRFAPNTDGKMPTYMGSFELGSDRINDPREITFGYANYLMFTETLKGEKFAGCPSRT